MISSLIISEGVSLHVHDWPLPPGGGEPIGTVVLVHGLGEHIGRYEHVASNLNEWGWNVVGYDLRGHGRSTGARGRLATADDLFTDLALVIEQARSRYSGRLVLFGHSMGGAVAAAFAAGGAASPHPTWWRPIDGLVLSSPALDPGMTGVQKALLAMLGRVAPNLAVSNGLKASWISHDPAVVAAYKADPLVHNRVTPRLAQAIVDAGRVAARRAPRWTVPTLLVYSANDRCVCADGSVEFARAAPAVVVTNHGFPSLAHEIFNEPERDQVFAIVKRWLNQY